jgi:dTDP-4-dehydrorhamnose reductase
VVNATVQAMLAREAAALGAWLVHYSTDYVFDGSGDQPWHEDDATAPLSVYGRTKLEGEQAIRRSGCQHLILRTSWVYAAHGANFVRTMLRLGAERETLGVVDDQLGCPTYAPHLADAILAIAAQIERGEASDPRWGIYHAAGTGETTWCGFAREIFRTTEARGLPSPALKALTTADYPTPARRPANSRLDCGKLAATFGVRLPDWKSGTRDCLERLLPT